MADRYPPTEPYDGGLLDVGDAWGAGARMARRAAGRAPRLGTHRVCAPTTRLTSVSVPARRHALVTNASMQDTTPPRDPAATSRGIEEDGRAQPPTSSLNAGSSRIGSKSESPFA